jgi:hypothetical protein
MVLQVDESSATDLLYNLMRGILSSCNISFGREGSALSLWG